jgi:hypothetical protein
MSRFNLAWELGGPKDTDRDRALQRYNDVLTSRPGVLAAALRQSMNGNTPQILHDALNGTQVDADPRDMNEALGAADAALDATRDGRVIYFAGGDTVFGDVWPHTNEVRAEVRSGERPVRDLGYTMLATCVALQLLAEQPAASMEVDEASQA